jgi:hypothetical protein
MPAIYGTKPFWEKHYGTTIELKQRQMPGIVFHSRGGFFFVVDPVLTCGFSLLHSVGDGERYAAKILSKHSDTWTLPLILQDMDCCETTVELDWKKRGLRDALLCEFQCERDILPSDTIRAWDGGWCFFPGDHLTLLCRYE